MQMKSFENIREVCKNFHVISFDIFDTLIFRMVEKPQDIFEMTADRAKEQQKLDKYISGKEFANIRVQAEKRARKKKKELYGNEEANIYEIYEELPESWNRKELLELELQTENSYCYANPEIKELLADLNGKTFILVSDMYLPKIELSKLLEACGIDVSYFDEIYISCDHGCSKDQGDLFRVVSKKYGTDFLHIGDNIVSDIEEAKKQGISTYYYDVLPQYNNVALYERCYFEKSITPKLQSLRQLAYHQENDFWGKMGAYVMGPFFAGFAEWVMDYAEENKIDLICPIMREGSTFIELFQSAVNSRKMNLALKLLYASREATNIIKAEKWNRSLYDSFYQYQEKAYIKDMLKALHLEKVSEFTIYHDILLKDAKRIEVESGKILYEYLWERLSVPEYALQIERWIAYKRELFVRYYEELTKGYHNVLLVDIGYSATIQRNIISTLNIANKDIPKCLVAIGDPTKKNSYFADISIRSYVSTSEAGQPLRDFLTGTIEIFEQLLMGDIGTTRGYKQKGENVEPIVAQSEISQEELQKKRRCQRGIYHFQNFYMKLCRDGKYLDCDREQDRLKDLQIIERVFEMPTDEEAENLLHLSYEERYEQGRTQLFYCNQDEKLLAEIGMDEFWHNGKKQEVKWPQGIMTLQEPLWLFENKCTSNRYDEYYTDKIVRLLKKMVEQKESTVTIYGAGELGREMLCFLQLYHIQVNGFVDKASNLWGKKINGIEIYSLSEAMQQLNLDRIIVASLAYVEEIVLELKRVVPAAKLYKL